MIYKIHPAIGVARVGNSQEWYLAPESAGGLPLLADGGDFRCTDFRDAGGKLRRQAARFQVFEYPDSDGAGAPVVPGKNGVRSIRWTVHVANKKACWYQFMANAGENGYAPDHPLRNPSKKSSTDRLALMIDPGPRTVEGPNRYAAFSRSPKRNGYEHRFPEGKLKPLSRSIDSLGEMRTDGASRLIFTGGYGISGSSAPEAVILNFANNDDWWDDISDGTVTAEVILDDKTGSVKKALSSWVIVAPPRFAPQLTNLVTLYDVIYDTSVRFMKLRPDIYVDGMWNRDYKPGWEDDILPILERAHNYRWVVAVPPKPHDFDWKRLGDPNPGFNAFRKYYLEQVRPPDQTNRFASSTTGLPMMPYLCGDNCIAQNFSTENYLTLTRTQYFYLLQWAKGSFKRGRGRALPAGEQLDRAALENCSGGAFSPGIEMSWIGRNPVIYEQPFRIRLKSRAVHAPLTLGSDLESGLEPGDLSKYQALPWQADFNECSSEQLQGRFLWWWPVQRPTFVHVDKKQQAAWIGSSNDQNAPDYVQFAQNLHMVRKWSRLGFLFNKGTRRNPLFLEVARTPPR